MLFVQDSGGLLHLVLMFYPYTRGASSTFRLPPVRLFLHICAFGLHVHVLPPFGAWALRKITNTNLGACLSAPLLPFSLGATHHWSSRRCVLEHRFSGTC